ncbi:large subunit GTPase 1 homolog isoform X2 [Teleopsis dalmanni]|uniref:large subunit GTPase 1 homolog isoform X2 n=1 Tax=Teleopsis dalmanni TaxID=139649 RepID=UPI0018CF554C|nr:large subunit GTPase 1 homolog isoform X2 [Teleopsis dalmanni]XP_037936027.1 large subunit GTPase 1 homolog isoform X2 [Teleopsis dalmanni]
MSKKGKGSSNLGRSLIKDRFGHANRKKVDNDTMLHTTEIQDGYDWGRLNLTSVTEESSFQDFLRTAELAGTEFQAEKLNITFINPKQGVGLLSKTQQQIIKKKHDDNRDLLKIPRRPKWTADTTAEELERAENESFLNWRRDLTLLQEEDEEMLMTPYEKNLEFWRQLWRVVERSDVVIQIVDARNPLLFRSDDLEKYVKEVDENKMNVILLNKSDLLTDQQRVYWADYFDKQGIRTAFFSAVLAAEELKLAAEAEKLNKVKVEDGIVTDEDALSMKEIKAAANEINQALDVCEEKLSQIEQKIYGDDKTEKATNGVTLRNNPKVLTRLELIEFLKTVYNGSTRTPNVTTVGLVGYPNVGKSSTINALMTQKKVSVSATPGKTKHFQTLYLDKDLLLCDCPGLVMPSFVLTKADMILNGILPIDQMRDHVPAVNLLCTRIPRHVLEDKYGIIIAKPMEGEDPTRCPHSEELLLAYGYNRGFMTSNGQPDQSRSARYVCKDYVNGKLLFAIAPPDVPQDEYHIFPERQRKQVDEKALPSQQQRAMRV